MLKTKTNKSKIPKMRRVGMKERRLVQRKLNKKAKTRKKKKKMEKKAIPKMGTKMHLARVKAGQEWKSVKSTRKWLSWLRPQNKRIKL